MKEDGPGDGLREDVGDHQRASEVTRSNNAASDKITKKLGSTKNMLSLFEGDRVEGQVDGRLRVAEEGGRGVDGNVQINKQFAKEDKVLRGDHGAEVLSLGAREGDRTLVLREPMNGAAMEEEKCAAA